MIPPDIMTLGRLIDALSGYDPQKVVRMDFGMLSLGYFCSYRGYYNHLAIEPRTTVITVGEFLEECNVSLDQKFTGYKGGQYLMNKDTPIWFSAYGKASGIAVVGVGEIMDEVVLKTKDTKA